MLAVYLNDGTPVPLSTGKTMLQTNHALELVRRGEAYMVIVDSEWTEEQMARRLAAAFPGPTP